MLRLISSKCSPSSSSLLSLLLAIASTDRQEEDICLSCSQFGLAQSNRLMPALKRDLKPVVTDKITLDLTDQLNVSAAHRTETKETLAPSVP